MNKSLVFSDDIDASLEKEICGDHLYKNIIKSKAFNRLKDISFLGAIDKTHSNKQSISNRFEHSLDVAKLALFVCKKRGYSKEIEKHVVSAALLHDIGHAPLSHSMELSFTEKYGLNHHMVGENIITGKEKKHIELSNYLKDCLDIGFVTDLLNKKSKEEFSDIFSSSINIDTIDGIHKSLQYLFSEKQLFNKYSIAEAAFLPHEKRCQILDRFWSLKGLVYNEIITSKKGALSDFFSQKYFDENNQKIDETHFISTEQPFLGKGRPIFKSFKKKLSSIYIYDERSSVNEISKLCSLNYEELNVVKRNYIINSDVKIDSNRPELDFMNERYKCEKEPQKMVVKFFFKDEKESTQTSFL